MKKLLLLVFITFICCKTEINTEKSLEDKVFKSTYLLGEFKKLIVFKSNISLASKGTISKKNIIEEYADEYSYYFGKTNNFDSIVNRINNKSEFYQKYLIYDTFVSYSTDSVVKNKYSKKRLKTLQFLQKH